MTLEETCIKFQTWVDECKPGTVSIMVLGSLARKYADGDPDPLFKKMQQLERDEHYGLCAIFKSMFDSLGINDEYLRWKNDK